MKQYWNFWFVRINRIQLLPRAATIEEILKMNINTDLLVPMTEANQNFSKVVRLVDESGMAVIMKNNKPRYIVLSFAEYDEIQAARSKMISAAADSVIKENTEALLELAE
jgi:antitoxin Phd